jgi:hypothetical protein
VTSPRVYPSIPHLPGSRCAEDRTLPAAQARRLVGPSSARDDPADEVIVQEKLDGSCVAVVRRDGRLLALGREGRPCAESGNEARRWFADWVADNASRLDPLVGDGEALVGEWLALVHGTRYALEPHDAPFVPFDVLRDGVRLPVDALAARLAKGSGLAPPRIVHRGAPIAIAEADRLLERTNKAREATKAIDPPEGLVYRLERGRARVVLVAKWVRPGKIDGSYLPENSGNDALYHWRPK